MPTISGSGGAKTISVSAGDKLTVTNFGAFGTGSSPSDPAELDTLQLLSAGMTAANLQLAQAGANVVVTFEGVPATQVTLTGVTVEQLANIAGAGNFQFFGDASVIDRLDVWNVGQVGSTVDQANVATFLNDLANTVSGLNGSADAINGQGGDDVLAGLSGDDVLRGEEGNDRLDGGLGADRLVGGNGNDTYVVDDAGDTVVETNGTGGIDTVLSTITYQLAENLENLTLTGHATIHGTGNGLANVIAGNDATNGVSAGAGDDTLFGNAGDDYLSGEAGNDKIDGGVGNDFLNGGAGLDVMNGGRGDDSYSVDDLGDQVIETVRNSSGGGIDIVHSFISYTLGSNLDDLDLAGSALAGTGNELRNRIYGNGAKNVVAGEGGDDLVYGLGADDQLSGGDGNDVLYGSSGRDTLNGDNGDDVLNGEQDPDTLQGGNGNDVLNGGESTDNLDGGSGNDQLDGGSGNDTLLGGSGSDLLNGSKGADTMDGGLGDDTYYVDNIGDIINEAVTLGAGGGLDSVLSSVSYTLSANVDHLSLTGHSAINGTGNALANIMNGNDVLNTLSGGAGNDTLIADTFDTIKGEADDDTLVLLSTFGNADGGDGTDTLKLDAIKGDIDITDVLGDHLVNIDIVDLSFNGSGQDQNLILDAAAVAAVNGTSGAFGDKTLLVNGETTDTVTFDDSGWSLAGTAINPFGQAGSYNKFVNGDATLYVEDEVAVIGIV